MGFSFARVSQVLVPQSLRIGMRERSLKRFYICIYITIPQWRFSERSQFVQRNRMHVQLIMKWLLYQLYQAIAGTRHPAAAHVYSYNHLHIRHNLYVYIYLSVCLSILLSICIYIYVYLSIDIL